MRIRRSLLVLGAAAGLAVPAATASGPQHWSYPWVQPPASVPTVACPAPPPIHTAYRWVQPPAPGHPLVVSAGTCPWAQPPV